MQHLPPNEPRPRSSPRRPARRRGTLSRHAAWRRPVDPAHRVRQRGNLKLAEATGRAREIAIRTALGASRRRVIAQLLMENVLLFATGALVALIGAAWTIDGLR